MRIVLVGENDCIRPVKECVMEMEGISQVEIFFNYDDALLYILKSPVDLVMLDVNLDGRKCEDGIEIGNIIKKINSKINIIYISGNPESIQYMHSLELPYLAKPYILDELLSCIEAAKNHYIMSKRKIFVRTFGHFDVFINGEPIMFKSAKAKELLAILIDRKGGTLNNEQIITILWEDRPNDCYTQNLCSKVCRKLKNELKKNGIEDILISKRGIHRLDITKFECDMYKLVDTGEVAEHKYFGEYMMEYSWSEWKLAFLDKYM